MLLFFFTFYRRLNCPYNYNRAGSLSLLTVAQQLSKGGVYIAKNKRRTVTKTGHDKFPPNKAVPNPTFRIK